MTGIGRLGAYVRRYWRRYLLGALCLLVTSTLIMLIPWWIRAAVRIIEEGGRVEDVTAYAVTIGVAAVFQGIARTLSRLLMFNAARDIEYDLRNDLFAHLQKLSLNFYHSRRTGDLMSRVINDISSVRMLLGPGILNLINAPLYYLYAMLFMLSIDARMTFAALLPYPILIWAVRRFRGRILQASLRVHEQMGELSNHIQENLSGMHVVKAYAQEQRQIRQFFALNEDYQKRSMDLADLRGRIEPFMKVISGVTVLIVLWYGGARVMRGDLMIADVVAFIAYLNALAWPTAAFGWMLSLIERGRASMKRLEEVLEVEPDIAGPNEAAPVRSLDEAVEFRGVGFGYARSANGQGALKDIDLTIRRGETVGIVGRTGAGKTSLAQLLPRLHDVSSGAIDLDGRDIRTVSLSDLRRMIGYVPQDPFLFSTTLKRNLAFGRDEVSDAEIARVVSLARLDRDVAHFPQGLDTIVGERGVTLSGGQKQRATLARALLIDPPILVLDDCLSSVDAETEAQILRGLKNVLAGKTCLIVSHRISAVKDADEILVLDEGAVIERGSHASLLRKGGLYAEIYRQQQLAEELEQI